MSPKLTQFTKTVQRKENIMWLIFFLLSSGPFLGGTIFLGYTAIKSFQGGQDNNQLLRFTLLAFGLMISGIGFMIFVSMAILVTLMIREY
ncbi:MAG: hypothetical protein C4584_02785 [Armatimonadetes bacterium]|nr:MAG: hypothetical protein C4584_02785 [Armatimonadota bacterium]